MNTKNGLTKKLEYNNGITKNIPCGRKIPDKQCSLCVRAVSITMLQTNVEITTKRS